MSLYYQDENVVLHHGDCIEVMRTMPAESVDSIVTDPPYGLGFMGKKWDSLPPGEEWARECLRVLKPGGHILAFGGTRTWHRLAVAIEDAGFEMRDSLAWLYGSGFPKHRAALKPAFEPIVMGRKPFKGSLAANEAIHGTGALSIDECRIVRTEGDRNEYGRGHDLPHANTTASLGKFAKVTAYEPNSGGRWPANVILDQHTAELLDEQSGDRPVGRFPGSSQKSPKFTGATYNGGKPYAGRVDEPPRSMGDSGGASRFFYVAKAPKKERPNVNGTIHPTVKPLTLMRWLCKLVTPEHGTILDTFAGSGTTIEAALIEGYNVIGIEMETEYLPLIQHRINRANGGKP